MSQPLRLVPQAAQSIAFSCPICSGVHAAYVFGVRQVMIYHCAGCALMFSTSRSQGTAPSDVDDSLELQTPIRSEKDHLSLISALEAASITGPVLVVAEPGNEIVPLLERRGIRLGRVVGHQDFGEKDWDGDFKSAIVSATLMRVANPRLALEKIRRHLPAGAPLVLSLPLRDSKQAKLMGRNWHEWQPFNRWYFTRETLNLLLLSSGFEHVWFRPEQRKYSLNNLSERMRRSLAGQSWRRGLETVQRLPLATLRDVEFPLPSGTVVVSATAAEKRHEFVVSIIVPLFNEARTFRSMMDMLLAKQLRGMRKEIIIVESNSTDGSRELALTYRDHPNVSVILQPKPRGKGNAVREGVKAATGDILMIQDADLEYDFDDYDGLLAPLVAWQSMFVLGSRHQGGWKMRTFTDAPLAAAFFNLGHTFFRSLVNISVNGNMADPFTMFKVMRRDAIFGLNFVCNRFDFDIELVIKLIRKGYTPLEIPVNYMSRSFAEGKKVSVTRDGLTWIKTVLQARFSSLGDGHE